jgi:predicted short-subunit dehydrogenase-like oxidoreductase (DUF2520 family)
MLDDEALNIAIVGQGRLGGAVARRLEAAGQKVRRVRRGEAVPEVGLIWLLVPDRALAEVAAELAGRPCPMLHSSGALGPEALCGHRPAGALHPLMSFPSAEAWPEGPIPASLAGDPEAVAAGGRLAELLGWSTFALPGDRRLYHAAAVLAGNGATALLGLGAELLVAAGVPAAAAPALLAPLVLTSLRNAAQMGPRAALTGPVVRGDLPTLVAHRAAISAADPTLLPAYNALVEATLRLMSGKLEAEEGVASPAEEDHEATHKQRS